MNIILFYFVHYEESKGEVMNLFSRSLSTSMKNSSGACRPHYKAVTELLFLYLTHRCAWPPHPMESSLF